MMPTLDEVREKLKQTGYASVAPVTPEVQTIRLPDDQLRVLLAGMAMQGMWANPKVTEHPAFTFDATANEALRCADALLAAAKEQPCRT